MKNPYIVLEIPQDADRSEVKKAQMLAMMRKKHSLQDIAIAAKQLLDPARRLAADFMFPAKIKSKRVQKVSTTLMFMKVEVESLDIDALNSI